MDPALRVWPAAERGALAHVAQRARGGPLQESWRVTVHFHPDRVVAGTPILRAMAADGRYRSQFETGTGNGGLTAHPGGDRWRWESRLFGGAYDGAPAEQRPVHGSLNHRRRDVGGSPRFGSAHLRLRSETLSRSTSCYPNSVFEPVDLGTHTRAGVVALADVDDHIDPLDDYVEAHVHGGVCFDRDVEALVLDPSHRGTDVERDAHLLEVPVEWHQGFSTAVDVLARHPDYRGPSIVGAAVRIAPDGT